MNHQYFTTNDIMKEIMNIKEMLYLMNDKPERPQVKPCDELWTVNDVAGYLHKSKSTIQAHYQNRHDFPRSKKIGKMRYWRPQEIIEYAKRRTVY